MKFQVVETMDDGIKVKAEHKFNRSDFKLGEKKELPVAQELTIQLEMMLKKSA